MESMIKILGAFIDTLVLNVYPTDASFEIEERRLDESLKEELMLLKGQAQEAEEEMPTRFCLQGKAAADESQGWRWFQLDHGQSYALGCGQSQLQNTNSGTSAALFGVSVARAGLGKYPGRSASVLDDHLWQLYRATCLQL